MDKEQLAEEAELGDRDVGATRGLETLDAADTDADVCRLDHRDIVGSVTDGEKDGPLLVLLDQLDHHGLL